MVKSLENWPSLKELEKVFYEKHAYEQLLAYMASNNIGNYQEYFDNYVSVIKEYRQLCKQLEKEIIFPATDNKGGMWEVDFVERTVEIREETN